MNGRREPALSKKEVAGAAGKSQAISRGGTAHAQKCRRSGRQLAGWRRVDPKPGGWKRRSSAGDPISSYRATAPHFAQWVIAQYSPRRGKHCGRPPSTGMNCGFEVDPHRESERNPVL